MRGEQDRLSLVAHLLHDVPERAAGLWIETRRRLIQENEGRIIDERQRQRQPLLLAAGKMLELGFAALLQPHQL